MSGCRQLTNEERELWSGVVRSITPLRRTPQTGKSSAVGKSSALGKTPAPAPGKPRELASPMKTRPAQAPPLAPLERRLRQRLARGREPIDARIDLHGMTQRRAHAALLAFLHRAQASGARMVLVVTGKGESRAERDAEGARGVLKRQVPIWFSLPEFRSFIVGFDDAHVGHGGQGALYVRLRRAR